MKGAESHPENTVRVTNQDGAVIGVGVLTVDGDHITAQLTLDDCDEQRLIRRRPKPQPEWLFPPGAEA